MRTCNKQHLLKEEKTFEKKLKRRNVGLIMNLFGSSSLIFLTIFLVVILGLIYFWAGKEKIQTGLNSTVSYLENKLKSFIDEIKQSFNPDEMYEELMKKINTEGITITIDGQSRTLDADQIRELVEKILPKQTFVDMVNHYLEFGDIKLPSESIKKLIDKFPWESFDKYLIIALVTASSLTVVNILNIIFASRLVIANGIIAKVGFIITSILSFNLINWIGLSVFSVNDKKE
ncbi:hypothetical protein EELLY_v1c06660 [Entomoplasma ellychniae]|uniref:Uncharacterized protein n=1 Tax=Entomoplasma ellychniae TaxID=2114 RepID=A0A8E2UB19_9MOLU|nr:hypothetical protein [Entomoplasma ellychniae]PPE04980.1 hypothetical protein EELLY_v1c06660 [Entomoplasma ellychniae]